MVTLLIKMHKRYEPQTHSWTMLKWSGQILAQCHISVTRWLEFEIMPELHRPLCEWVIKCPYMTASENTVLTTDVRSAGFEGQPHLPPSHAQDRVVQDSMWPGRRSPTETFKVVVIGAQRGFRSVVRVAYPLTGALLLISHSSADCISSC